ncbi:MAG: ATPase, T2SS/T4P/T4SS family, partial [Candidatus Peregrinibacteria bacterium]|nr:ATPase, T2SS/T4P/T4SS family [Candidatus Peregrinibacteria bacterium]
ISTLHTNSAIESISRLANMGVKSFILAPALDLIIAQRLVRKLCECAEEKPVTETEAAQLKTILENLAKKGIEAPAMPATMKHAKGCDKCGHIGYLGQLAIAEVLRFNDALRSLILENKPMSEIYSYINENLKMLSLQEDGALKVIRGDTTLEEVFRVAA